MPFEGSLEDMPLEDVLQLLHVSQKSGVLRVCAADRATAATIVVRDGRIVGARHPNAAVNIGNVLVELGAINHHDIEDALHLQQAEGTPLVGILIDMGRLSQETGYKALEKLVERTFVEVVGWRKGSFTFDVQEIATTDDFSHFPSGLEPDLSVDTQMMLMEAVRILDERNRDGDSAPQSPESPPSAEPPAASIPDVAPASRPPAEAPPAVAGAPALEPPAPPVAEPSTSPVRDGDDESRLLSAIDGDAATQALRHNKALLLTEEGLLKYSLLAPARQAGIDLQVSAFAADAVERLEAWVADGLLPVLLFDATSAPGRRLPRELEPLLMSLRERHPQVSVVLLSEGTLSSYVEGFKLGAAAVLPCPREAGDRGAYLNEMHRFSDAIIHCLASTFARRGRLHQGAKSAGAQIAALKDRVNELRSRSGSSEISLVLLRQVAEALDRCVIFLVRRDDLLGLGASGYLPNGEPISSVAMRLKIPLGEESVLSRVARDGVAFHGRVQDPVLRSRLYPAIGAPRSPEVVLLPLRAEDKTAALIYGDFGKKESALVQIDALEILATQAGMALELALWRARRTAG
jgi:hypothetical protein